MSIVRFRRPCAADLRASFPELAPAPAIAGYAGVAALLCRTLPALRWTVAGSGNAPALQDALLAGELDAVVFPVAAVAPQLAAGLTAAAVLPRSEARDRLVFAPGRPREWRDRPFAALPFGARIGVSQPRQIVQLREARPELRFGRLSDGASALEQLRAGDFAAVLLPGDAPQPGHDDALLLDPAELLPETGAGVLVVVVRSADECSRRALRPLDHAPTRLAVATEQALLAQLGAAAGVIVSAHARIVDGVLQLGALVADPAGRLMLRRNLRATEAQAGRLAAALATKLRAAAPPALLA